MMAMVIMAIGDDMGGDRERNALFYVACGRPTILTSAAPAAHAAPASGHAMVSRARRRCGSCSSTASNSSTSRSCVLSDIAIVASKMPGRRVEPETNHVDGSEVGVSSCDDEDVALSELADGLL